MAGSTPETTYVGASELEAACAALGPSDRRRENGRFGYRLVWEANDEFRDELVTCTDAEFSAFARRLVRSLWSIQRRREARRQAMAAPCPECGAVKAPACQGQG